MIATLGIYVAAALLVALVGAAARAAIWPDRSPLRLDCLPLGVSTLVLLLYLVGYPMPVPTATYVLVAVAVVVLGWWAWRRRVGGGEPAPDRLLPPVGDVVLLALGLGAGVLALAPVLQLGFPTTISATIADGWSYVSEITWLRDHSLGADLPDGTVNPFAGVLHGQLTGGLGVGFELLATAVVAITGRAPFEMVNAVSALAFPVWVIGWAELWRGARDAGARWASVPVAAIALSPAFVLPFAENQAPHALGLALLPFALATALALGRDPRPRALIVAAISSGGALGVYTGLLPWLLLGVCVAVLAGRLTAAGAEPRLRRVLEAGVTVTALAVAVVVIAALPVRQALRFIGTAGNGTAVTAPKLPAADDIVLGTGAGVRYAFAGHQPTTWAAGVGVAIVLIVVGVAVASLVRRRHQAPAQRLAWVLGALAAATLVVVTNFIVKDTYGYGAFKAVVTGGALIAGAVVVALVPSRPRAPWAALRLAAVAALLVVWAGTSASLLQATGDAGQQGFRRADVQMGRQLDALPPGSTLLVEGVDGGPTAFRMQMMAAYFGAEPADLELEGIGSTPSYIAQGGQVEWRPDRPWRWVLTSGPQVVSTPRREVWRNEVYALAEAAALDVTPYGTGWYGVEGAAAWTRGPVQLVVSNRSPAPRHATLSLTATSNGIPRLATLAGGGARSRATIPAGRRDTMSLTLMVPARSVVPVTLSAAPPATPAPAGDPRELQLMVSDVHVSAP